MAARSSASYIPHLNATISSPQHFLETPTQHASEGPYRRGNYTGNYAEHSPSGTGLSRNFQAWQGQTNTPVQNQSNHRTEGQWTQQQQPWQFFNPSFAPPANFLQPNFQDYASFQQPTWQQQQSQFGHINPAFFPKQPVAYTPHSANDTTGHRRVDPSSWPTHDARQQPGPGYSHWSHEVSMANGQAQPTADHQYNNQEDAGHFTSHFTSINAHHFVPKPKPNAPPHSQYPNSHSTAWHTVFPTSERYDNRFPQLEGLLNPSYMRTPQLTLPGENPRQYLLPHPKPSPSYLEQARQHPRRLSSPKKLLVVLDLNGTLLLRSNRGSSYTPRPHVDEFLAYCLENHALIIWSSARPHNVTAMVAQLFTAEQRARLVKIWSREHLRLGVHFDAKVQVYKQLTWLWEDAEVQASFTDRGAMPFKIEDGWKEPLPAKWDQSNTILLDDSVDKAASEPHNLVQVDEFTKETKLSTDDVLGRVVAYIEDLKFEADVSAAMRERPFVNGQVEGWDWSKKERRPSA